jgi:aldehyde:ferredoxin oxidoreductase
MSMTTWKGRRAWVDLTEKTVTYDDIPEKAGRKWGGMKGLALPVLLERLHAGTDPLGPDNPLVVAAGLLNGLAFPGVCRYGLYARSPLTGGYGETEAGGYFGPAMKNQGLEMIVITGASENPVYLWIEDGTVEIRDASSFWGQETGPTLEELKKDHGEKITSIFIGPAGERQVRYACVINDLRHANGRTGMGAVLGSKKLKALAAPAPKPEKPADPVLLKECHEIFRGWKDNPLSAGLYELGTTGGVLSNHQAGLLPTKNFRQGTFEKAADVDGRAMNERLLKERHGCFSCMVKCKRVVEGGPMDLDPRYGGPEYETLAAFGACCGVEDLDAVCKAHERCNALGLDTISTGVIISWAMECVEKGLIDASEAGVTGFGDTKGMLETVDAIAARTGFGALLSEGVRRASRQLGPASEAFAMHVKGQEVPMHEPRGKTGLSLGYALAPVGADHIQFAHDTMIANPDSYGFKAVKCLGITDPPDLLSFDDEKLRNISALWKHWALMNHLGGCLFVFAPRSHYPVSKIPMLVEAATGWETSLYELLTAAERGIAASRLLNARLGIGPEEDRLPERFFEPLPDGPFQGKAIGKEDFEDAKGRFFQIMGWDSRGVPTEATCLKLGLEEFLA